MGVPIKQVNYNFSLTPNQAEFFDEILRRYSSRISSDLVTCNFNKDYKTIEYLEKEFEKFLQVQDIIIKGSSVVQD